jgi:hypothetical protein
MYLYNCNKIEKKIHCMHINTEFITYSDTCLYRYSCTVVHIFIHILILMHKIHVREYKYTLTHFYTKQKFLQSRLCPNIHTK